MNNLALSIVIPSYNRQASLLEVMEAFTRQTLPPASFEVIVSLDANTDGSEAAVRARDWPFAVRITAPSGRGAAAARNAGAALATGQRLVFLDDDITVDPGFFAAHLAAAEPNPVAVVVGQSAPAIPGTDWFSQGLRIWWQDRFFDLQKPGRRFGYTDLMSGNVSIPKALFDQVGGFDGALRCREDYELGYRLIAAGAQIAYAHAARGLHHDRSTLPRNLGRANNEGRADVQILRKHPGLYTVSMVRNLNAQFASTRLLRWATFSAPALGHRLQGLLVAVIPTLEKLGARRLWQKANHAVWAYSYYASAAAELGSVAALHDLAGKGGAIARPKTLIADLLDGIDAVVAKADAERPDGIYVNMGAWEAARIDPAPGFEPLTGAHVAAMLADRAHDWAAFAAANDSLPPLPAADPAEVPPVWRTETGYSMGSLDLADWSLFARNESLHYPMRLLVRRGRLPLGWVYLMEPPAPGTFWAELRRQVFNNTGIGLGLLRAHMLPAAEPALPPVTVVICTRDRTETLRRCLAAVQALDYPGFEVLVVDNAPTTDGTEKLVRSLPGIRYQREDRPGLDWARNCGARHASHAIVAYTDDDTQVDHAWLRGIAAGFSEPDVQAVTGLVLPMKLDTDAQTYFEDVYGGMGKGFKPRICDRKTWGARGILWASACGVGANMAFRRSVFDLVGPFDPALDVGTATRGGGDIEMFHRVMASGAVLAYAPEAMVWHEHRTEEAALLRQLRDNGSGFAAYLMAAWRNRTVPRLTILRFAARDWIWGWFVLRYRTPGRHTRTSILAEFNGMRAGRAGYLKALADADALTRAAPDPAPAAAPDLPAALPPAGEAPAL